MKKFIAVLLIMSALLPLSAAKSETTLKVAVPISWTSSSVDIPELGTSSTAANSVQVAFYLEEEIFFGEKAEFGLHFGTNIANIPLHGVVNGTDISEAMAVVLFPELLIGMSRRLPIDPRTEVVISSDVHVGFGSNKLEGVGFERVVTVGISGDVSFVWKPSKVVGLRAGTKIGGPVLAHDSFKSENIYVPSYDEFMDVLGFTIAPYIGLMLSL